MSLADMLAQKVLMVLVLEMEIHLFKLLNPK